MGRTTIGRAEHDPLRIVPEVGQVPENGRTGSLHGFALTFDLGESGGAALGGMDPNRLIRLSCGLGGGYHAPSCRRQNGGDVLGEDEGRPALGDAPPALAPEPGARAVASGRPYRNVVADTSR